MAQKTDCLVVGGGAVGLTVALTLAAQHRRVTLADAGFAQASWAGGGILSPLPPWRYSLRVNALAQAGAARWRLLLPRLREKQDCQWWRCGMLVLPPHDEKQLRRWRADGGIIETRPGGGRWLGQVAQMRPPRVLAALRELLTDAGVLMRTAAVEELQTKNGRAVHADMNGGGRLSAAMFVICGGAWSGRLCPSPPLSLRPQHGQINLYRPAQGAPMHIILSAQDNFYCVPRRDGLLLAGTTAGERGFDPRPTENDGARIEQLLARHCPDLAAGAVIKSWAGLRPMTTDNLPIIDRHPRLSNVFINAGHGRYGFTMAPAAAKILAQVMDGESSPYPYR